jgi:hypothetical protein
MAKIGVITEQGDLGLGFDPISKKDSKQIQKNNTKETTSNGKDKKEKK